MLLTFLSTGQVLGFKSFPPPYMAPTTVGPVVLQGVNYASGASGILDESGANYVSPMSIIYCNICVFLTNSTSFTQ